MTRFSGVYRELVGYRIKLLLSTDQTPIMSGTARAFLFKV